MIDSPYYHGYIDIEVVTSRLQEKPVGAYLVWKTADCDYVISYVLRQNEIRHSLISIHKSSDFMKSHPDIKSYDDCLDKMQQKGVLFTIGIECPDTGLGSHGQINPMAGKITCSVCQQQFPTMAKKHIHAQSHRLSYCSKY